MNLFTEQPLVVWQIIKTEHCYHPDPDNLNVMDHLDQDFADAYTWLINQFNQRIPKPNQVTIPIWWWLDNGVRTKEFQEDIPPKPVKVIIEADYPNNQILLSDFEKWHYVLNKWYLPDDINNDSDDYYDQIDQWFDHLSSHQQQVQMQKSWQQIFNLDDQWPIQANTWSIDFANITKVYTKNQTLYERRSTNDT